MLELICAHTYTAGALHRRLGLLQECLEEAFFHSTASTDAVALKVVSHASKIASKEDAEVFAHVPSDMWKEFTLHNFADVIASLTQESQTLPVLTLYVPVAFDDAALASISSWCRLEIHKALMLEIIVKPSTVGGCAFVFGDTYHDISLHDIMHTHKGVVAELLNSYV